MQTALQGHARMPFECTGVVAVVDSRLAATCRDLLQSYDHFSAGQSYVGESGIHLNVYKRSCQGLVMSSFEDFSSGVCGGIFEL